MMNKYTGYWLDNFVRTTHLQDNLIPGMENNLTATMNNHILYGWI